MSPLTPLGKKLRIIRINLDERLSCMAAKLDVSSAFLSAVERGHRAPPYAMIKQIIELYSLNDDPADELMRLAALQAYGHNAQSRRTETALDAKNAH